MNGKINLSLLIVIVFNVYSTYSQRWSCVRQPERCIDVSKINCKDDKYRKMDGSCNNPLNPTLGMPFTSYRRLLPARYADDIYEPPVALSGNSLPSARLLSYEIFGRTTVEHPNLSMINMAWGQAMVHDTSSRISSRSTQLITELEVRDRKCCSVKRFYEVQHTEVPCLPIPVPSDDPFFIDAECLNFDRTITEKDQRCPGSEDPAPAEQLTGVTHYLDLSFVYGNSVEESLNLRAMTGGLLRTSDKFGQFPPRNPSATRDPRHDDPYSPIDPDVATYLLGDGRGNQNPGLTIVHIVLLREHNRIARELVRLNPHWDDEKLFQEARRINIAQYQFITYYEWNVNFIGVPRSLERRLTYEVPAEEHVNDYNTCADPRSTQSFQHSSFRFFHTHIMGTFHLATESRDVYNSSILLSTVLGRSGILEEGCPFSPALRGCQYSSFVRGLSNQAAAEFDKEFDPELVERFPVELRAFDLQRDRDHGIASYNNFREFCGLPRAADWGGYSDHISDENIGKMKDRYESHEDVDLSIGAALETPLPDAVVGPTFTCINNLQFLALRTGDRYFFENAKQPYPFTRAQLAAIRKSSVSRLLCDNGDVKSMQRNAFKQISPDNPLLDCTSLPRVDLSLWEEAAAVLNR